MSLESAGWLPVPTSAVTTAAAEPQGVFKNENEWETLHFLLFRSGVKPDVLFFPKQSVHFSSVSAMSFINKGNQ